MCKIYTNMWRRSVLASLWGSVSLLMLSIQYFCGELNPGPLVCPRVHCIAHGLRWFGLVMQPLDTPPPSATLQYCIVGLVSVLPPHFDFYPAFYIHNSTLNRLEQIIKLGNILLIPSPYYNRTI